MSLSNWRRSFGAAPPRRGTWKSGRGWLSWRSARRALSSGGGSLKTSRAGAIARSRARAGRGPDDQDGVFRGKDLVILLDDVFAPAVDRLAQQVVAVDARLAVPVGGPGVGDVDRGEPLRHALGEEDQGEGPVGGRGGVGG